VWPAAGQIAVVNPPDTSRLPGVTVGQVHIIDGFKPSHDQWLARGYSCSVALAGRYHAVVVCLPRAKSEARAMVAAAVAASNGVVVIDGQKTDGIDSLLRDVRSRVPVNGPVSKAHGKLFWFDARCEAFADWAKGPALTEGGFWTAPGVFSADSVDPASALLAAALPDTLGKKVADLGAGWGFLSAHVLTRDSVEEMHLVEAGHMALECARRNVTDPRAVFHWEDATEWTCPQKMDAVVMNPPFHASRAADPAIGQAFIATAARLLSPQGHLWMVANRHLPYESTLQSKFAKVAEVGSDSRFKLFHASKPLRKRG
jgi:16S rRNA (guanine1207-N2)-methyltransferase